MNYDIFISQLNQYARASRGGTPQRYKSTLDRNTRGTPTIKPETIDQIDIALVKAKRSNINVVPFIKYYVYGFPVSRIAEELNQGRNITTQQITQVEFFILGYLNK